MLPVLLPQKFAADAVAPHEGFEATCDVSETQLQPAAPRDDRPRPQSPFLNQPSEPIGNRPIRSRPIGSRSRSVRRPLPESDRRHGCDAIRTGKPRRHGWIILRSPQPQSAPPPKQELIETSVQ